MHHRFLLDSGAFVVVPDGLIVEQGAETFKVPIEEIQKAEVAYRRSVRWQWVAGGWMILALGIGVVGFDSLRVAASLVFWGGLALGVFAAVSPRDMWIRIQREGFSWSFPVIAADEVRWREATAAWKPTRPDLVQGQHALLEFLAEELAVVMSRERALRALGLSADDARAEDGIELRQKIASSLVLYSAALPAFIVFLMGGAFLPATLTFWSIAGAVGLVIGFLVLSLGGLALSARVSRVHLKK